MTRWDGLIKELPISKEHHGLSAPTATGHGNAGFIEGGRFPEVYMISLPAQEAI